MRPFAEPTHLEVPDAEAANGCFETMRVYAGKVFRLEDHLDRLYASAKFLGTPLPGTRQAVRSQLLGAVSRSGITEAMLRIALIPRSTDGGGRGIRPGALTVPSIVVAPVPVPSPAQYRSGVAVAVVPARKFSVAGIDPQAKYSARLGSVLAIMDAQLRGVDEALFMDAAGYVSESTASNFGMVKRGTIVTAPCWLGLLAGITRDVLFELAASLRLPIREAPITRHDLYNADEAFLLSTLKEVLSVTAVDGRRIGTGRPGTVSQRLLTAFRRLVRKELQLR